MAELEAALAALPAPPREEGVLRLLVVRAPGGRERPEELVLSPEAGVPGDAWARRRRRSSDAMVTVMEHGVAEVISGGQDLALFGDNLLVDLDLSLEGLPVGSRLAVGEAVCRVTPKPHRGCGKFSLRFGAEARALLDRPAWAARSLRGRHLEILEAGRVRVGDAVRVLSRG